MTNHETSAAVNYVALGDSTGAGVGAKQGGGYVARLFTRIEREHANARLTNLCVSGADTDDLIRDQLERGIKAQPTLVTIGIGINDVGHSLTVERFSRNYEEIVKRLKAQTSATIIISNIPDISYAPAVPANMRDPVNGQIKLFNERIGEIAARYDMQVVDVYTPTREVVAHHPEFFSDDGFHPSDAGYEYWAKTMWPAVKSAIESSATNEDR